MSAIACVREGHAETDADASAPLIWRRPRVAASAPDKVRRTRLFSFWPAARRWST
jgi:hypothetical protein